ncbi:MAG: hypothetical protein P9X22_06045 [Candidatus Zapsychrus exili]|nr:hypothetical protein [Candidatus Zapsychrus exili]
MKDCLLTPLISLSKEKYPIEWSEEFLLGSLLDVEIGFGTGEFLIAEAINNPGRNYVGIEQNWERIVKTLKVITRLHKEGKPLNNIRILRIDATVAFERLFAQKSINSIYCLYPCPWPKKGHIKNRLFSCSFLKLLNSRLKVGGDLRIVTDFYLYFEWVIEQSEDAGFSVLTNRVKPKYNTKFELKWCEGGQEEFFEIKMHKKSHVNVIERQGVELKTYKVKDFAYDNFSFENKKGEISVILKDKLFDKDNKRAMIYVIVSEQNLTQHLWVSIIKGKDFWYIARAEGQKFFATPAISEAIKLIYEAAKLSSE